VKTKNSIAYAYPTSITARHFDMSATGCYYIQQKCYCEDGTIGVGIHPMANSEAFLSRLDPGLIRRLNEIEDG
jgi:hypothetical protein